MREPDLGSIWPWTFELEGSRSLGEVGNLGAGGQQDWLVAPEETGPGDAVGGVAGVGRPWVAPVHSPHQRSGLTWGSCPESGWRGRGLEGGGRSWRGGMVGPVRGWGAFQALGVVMHPRSAEIR